MAEPVSIANEITDAGFWSESFGRIWGWIETSLFSQDTLVELGIIAVAAMLAWPLSRKLKTTFEDYSKRDSHFALLRRLWHAGGELCFPFVWLVIQWLAIVITDNLEIRNSALTITTSLLTAWVIVGIAAVFVANAFWSRSIAISAWILAALNILGLLDQTLDILDQASVTLGQVRVSALMIVQGVVTLGVLLWVTTIVGQIVEGKLKDTAQLSPSMQVLWSKLIWILLGTAAFLAALAIVGVDLTALAVLGGAVGVGLGFGLQKIFANLVSGFILLLDKSIKPGDTIVVADYFGRVDSLGARYVSVTTRDGIEYLIPNEELITTRVENWSHSNNLLRLRQSVGVHYKSDIHQVIQLCLQAAAETPRILAEPKSSCLLRGFGDNSVDFEMRFWINDPMNGRANVASELLINIWDKFKQHGIEIPYPQRDLHLRSSDIGLLSNDTDE